MGRIYWLALPIFMLALTACEQDVLFGTSLEPIPDAIADAFDGDSGQDNGDNNSGDPPGNGGDPPSDPRDADDPIDAIGNLCSSGSVQTMTQVIEFPNPGVTCDWGQNGNLEPLNLYFQARIEREVVLDVPETAILCDAQFDFARQEFRYDDHFLFLFDDYVISASYDFTDRLAQEPVSGLYLYDWENIVGMYWDTSAEGVYCAQFGQYVSSCDFPGHDTQGFIELEISPNHLQSMMVLDPPEGGHRFGVVTIGDNDTLDCEHTGMEFEVTLTYVNNL